MLKSSSNSAHLARNIRRNYKNEEVIPQTNVEQDFEHESFNISKNKHSVIAVTQYLCQSLNDIKKRFNLYIFR